MTAPLGKMETHIIDARIENVRFLESVGLHREHIARRVGMTRDAVDKMLDREKERSRQRGEGLTDTAAGAEAGQDTGPG